MNTIFDEDRIERIFRATGNGPCRTVVITATIAVPDWATREDAVREFYRWCRDDPGDAVGFTSIQWQDTKEDLEAEPDGIEFDMAGRVITDDPIDDDEEEDEDG